MLLEYSQDIYYSQKGLIRFGLKVSTHSVLWANQSRKFDKDFWTILSLRMPKCPDTAILYINDAH